MKKKKIKKKGLLPFSQHSSSIDSIVKRKEKKKTGISSSKFVCNTIT